MRFLLAVDGSAGSDAALAFLAALPIPAGDEVIVVSVARLPLLGHSSDDSLAVSARSAARVRAARCAEAAADELDLMGIHARALREEGGVAGTISRLALEEQADLIVLGSRGLGPWVGAVFGSVARALVRDASTPVLIVRERTAAPRRVLAAVDGSAGSDAALDLLARLPLPADASLTLVHVLEDEVRIQPMRDLELQEHVSEAIARAEREHVGRLLAAAAARVRAPRIRDSLFDRGHAAERIVRAAAADGSDLIVLGSHEEHGAAAKEADVADQVIASAHCAVLVGRAPVAPVKVAERRRAPELRAPAFA